MIRLAKEGDIENLLRMSELFFNASGYSDLTSFNKQDSKGIIEKLIESETIFTDGRHAMIAFVVFPLFMNKKTLMSQELFWWVDEELRGSRVGIQLLKKAEEASKTLGATVMNMLSIDSLNGESVNRIYEKLGYIKREQSYMRVL